MTVLTCKHCGMPRDLNYCWSCGPTTEDMQPSVLQRARRALRRIVTKLLRLR